MKMLIKRLALLLILGATMGGCAMTASIGVLEGEWVLTRLDGETIPAADAPRLTLMADGVLTGFAGCNQFRGGYSESAQTLSVSRLVATRKACEPAQMRLEQQFLDALGRSVAGKNQGGGPDNYHRHGWTTEFCCHTRRLVDTRQG